MEKGKRDKSSPKSGLTQSEVTRATRLIQKLKTMKASASFHDPVDPKSKDLKDYYKIIKKPMDLSTLLANVTAQSYDSMKDFEADLQLIWDNCIEYNEEGSPIAKQAIEMELATQKLLVRKEESESEEEKKPKKRTKTNGKHKSKPKPKKKESSTESEAEEEEDTLPQKRKRSKKSIDPIPAKSSKSGNTESDRNSQKQEPFKGVKKTAQPKASRKISRDEMKKLNKLSEKANNKQMTQIREIVLKYGREAIVSETKKNYRVQLDKFDYETYKRMKKVLTN